MYKQLTLLVITLSINAISYSQQSYNLPPGFQTFKDYDDQEQRLEADFDGDDVTDLAIVCSSEAAQIVVIYLSSQYLINENYFWFNWDTEMNSFSYQEDVLGLESAFGNGRFSKGLYFQYFESLRTMRLVRYTEEYLGNASHDGAYSKGFDLISGECRYNSSIGSATFEVITLSNIDDYFEGLEMFGETEIGETETEEGNTVELANSPRGVVEFLFEVSKSHDLSELDKICHPEASGDGDVRAICNISSQTEEAQASFRAFFGSGLILEEPLIDGNQATIKVKIGSDESGLIYEDIGVALYDGKWYLDGI